MMKYNDAKYIEKQMSKQRNKTKKDRPKYEKKKKKLSAFNDLKCFLDCSLLLHRPAGLLFFFSSFIFSSFIFFCQKSPESVVASFLFFTNSLSINSIFFFRINRCTSSSDTFDFYYFVQLQYLTRRIQRKIKNKMD